MKQILIVEDENDLSSVCKQKLEREGFEVTVNSTADDAIRYLEQVIPDLIILDIILPGKLDGFDFFRAIKNNPKTASIPVVILTNLDNKSQVAKELGAVDYLIKTDISIQDLVRKVKQVLG